MEDVLTVLRSFLPMPPIWGACRQVGSFLNFSMGEKTKYVSLEGKSYYMGTSALTVELCSWKMFDGDKEVLNNNCEDDKIYESVLSNFSEQQVIEIEKIKNTIIKIIFKNNWSIILEADLDAYERQDDLLSFYKKDNIEISYSVARGFHFYVVDS